LRIWNPDNGQTLCTLVGHTKVVRSVAVLPGGRVVSGSDDQTLRVWNPVSGETIATLNLEASIGTVTTTSDGLIVTGDRSGRVHFLLLEEPEKSDTRIIH